MQSECRHRYYSCLYLPKINNSGSSQYALNLPFYGLWSRRPWSIQNHCYNIVTSQWEVICLILSVSKQPVNSIYVLDTLIVAESESVKSECKRSFIAVSHYSILKCRIRHSHTICFENIPKSEFYDNLIFSLFPRKRLFRNKKVLTAETVRTHCFYSDKHINVNITPA